MRKAERRPRRSKPPSRTYTLGSVDSEAFEQGRGLATFAKEKTVRVPDKFVQPTPAIEPPVLTPRDHASLVRLACKYGREQLAAALAALMPLREPQNLAYFVQEYRKAFAEEKGTTRGSLKAALVQAYLFEYAENVIVEYAENGSITEHFQLNPKAPNEHSWIERKKKEYQRGLVLLRREQANAERFNRNRGK